LTDIAEQAYRIYLDRMDRPPAPMLADYGRLIEDSEVWLVETLDGVAGFIELRERPDYLEAANLAVPPDSQGQGLGRQLVELAERRAVEQGHTELRLYTNEVMTENLSFYRHLGFVETGRREQDGYRRVFLSRMITPRSA